MQNLRGTTILLVRRNNQVVIGGDGQVTQGNSIILKGNAKKVRKLYEDRVLVGVCPAQQQMLLHSLIFLKENSKNIKGI